jgi:prepilin peptidase CpaA
MSHSQQIAIWVLGVTALMLAWFAVRDIKLFKVRNEFVVLLAVLYFVYAIASGEWAALRLHVAFAILTLGGMLYLYMHEQIGGGDMKLISVASLWTGPLWAIPFAVLVTVFIALHYLAANMKWITAEKIGSTFRIPLSPSVAVALIALLVVSGLAPGY